MENHELAESLKTHIDDKFTAHEKLDEVIHDRQDEILKQLQRQHEKIQDSTEDVHDRVDRIETQMSMVKSTGSFLAAIFGGIMAWFGMHK